MSVPPLATTLLGVILAFHGLAIISTCFRLFHRLRTRRLWWDDFWAFIALLSTALLLIVYVGLPVSFILERPEFRQLWFWGQIILFTTALWSARITVAVTIVRLLPVGTMRRVATAVAIVFGLLYAALLIQKLALCATYKGTVENPVCSIPMSVAYLELSTDISADVWLIGSPAYMLWQMKLPRQHHRLILAIFVCGIFVTGASIAHSVFILENKQTGVGVSGHLEVAISLIVCNLIVVVTYIYRVFRKSDDDSVTISASESESASPSDGSSSQPIQSSLLSSARTPLSLTDIFTETSGGYSRSARALSSHGTFETTTPAPSSNGHPESRPLPGLSEHSDDVGIS